MVGTEQMTYATAPGPLISTPSLLTAGMLHSFVECLYTSYLSSIHCLYSVPLHFNLQPPWALATLVAKTEEPDGYIVKVIT